MKDFYGTEIKVGDEVAYIIRNRFYRGTVIKINKWTVSIRALEYSDYETRQFPKHLIVRQAELPEPPKG